MFIGSVHRGALVTKHGFFDLTLSGSLLEPGMYSSQFVEDILREHTEILPKRKVGNLSVF